MKKIEKLETYRTTTDDIVNAVNDLIDNQKEIIDNKKYYTSLELDMIKDIKKVFNFLEKNELCKDCGYIAPLKEVCGTSEEDKAWEHLENKPFKVKIIKCSKDIFWYNDKIGQVFNVEKVINLNSYILTEKIDEKYAYIDKQDCEIIEDAPSCDEKKYKQKMMICENADKCRITDCVHKIKHKKNTHCDYVCVAECPNVNCHEEKEIPDWKKAVENVKNNVSSNLEEIFKKYRLAISLMQTEIESLKQQLTESGAHSAGVINNLEVENKQLKQSQIKIDDDFIEILKEEIKYSKKYCPLVILNLSISEAERLLKQIRGER